MHATLFSLKRAFHASLMVTRPVLASFGLTPARFDMLFALYDDGDDEPYSADPFREADQEAIDALERVSEAFARNGRALDELEEEVASDARAFEIPDDVVDDVDRAHHDRRAPARPHFIKRVPQATLVRLLGVSRMTVSRMVRSLEELGLVRRTPIYRGSRKLQVELTDRGRAGVLAVLRDLMDSGAIDLAVDSMLDRVRWWSSDFMFGLRERFEGILRSIRNAGGDSASLVYSWHPDD